MKIKLSGIRVLTNFLCGSDDDIEYAIENGVIEIFMGLMEEESITLQVECCRGIGNVGCGKEEVVAKLFDKEAIKSVVNCASKSKCNSICIEALSALKCIAKGNVALAKRLWNTETDLIEIVMEILKKNNDDEMILDQSLEILLIYGKIKLNDDINNLKYERNIFEEIKNNNGIDLISELTYFENNEIQKKSKKLLSLIKQYFNIRSLSELENVEEISEEENNNNNNGNNKFSVELSLSSYLSSFQQ